MPPNAPTEKDTQAIKFRADEEKNTRKRAAMLGFGYADSRKLVDTPLLPDVLTVEEMYKFRMVPLSDQGQNGKLVFGITISSPQFGLKEVKDRFVDRITSFVMISLDGYKEFMARYDPPKPVEYDDIKIATEGESSTIESVSATLDTVKADELLDYLIIQADTLRASDIHFECAREYVRMRFRVDGMLHAVAKITHVKYHIVASALASRANISTGASEAQTGHMMFNYTHPKDGSFHELNMRIETVPTVFGQDAVVRLFNVKGTMLDLTKLGLSERELKTINQVISVPHGMVMVVGPTGSGKSTTLYSIINALNDPQRKIITLEDPVEYAIEGTSQIPVASRQGQKFGETLRAVLRLDPDIVMVGEIRDVDTAKTAVQASITGHLLLSTFHANDAASAMVRMVDMIGQNPIFINSIKMIVGQRLVRRLDDATKIAYEADEKTAEHIRKVLSDLPADYEKPNLDKITLYKPGSSEDNPFGYNDRIMMMEELLVDDAIQEFLRSDEKAINAKTMEDEAKRNGMITMEQAGMLKALQGFTTIEEIYRVL